MYYSLVFECPLLLDSMVQRSIVCWSIFSLSVWPSCSSSPYLQLVLPWILLSPSSTLDEWRHYCRLETSVMTDVHVLYVHKWFFDMCIHTLKYSSSLEFFSKFPKAISLFAGISFWTLIPSLCSSPLLIFAAIWIADFFSEFSSGSSLVGVLGLCALLLYASIKLETELPSKLL